MFIRADIPACSKLGGLGYFSLIFQFSDIASDKAYSEKPVMEKKSGIIFRARGIYLLIGVFGLLAAGTAYYSLHRSIRIGGVYAPLADAAMVVKLEATMAHLWLEEIIAGDRSVEPAVVWRHLERADRYARAMLEGGGNIGQTFTPMDDAEIRRKIRDARKKIAQLKEIAGQRLTQKKNLGPGSGIDRRYDAVFAVLLDRVDEAKIRLQQTMDRDIRHFRLIQIILSTAFLVLALAAAWVFRRFFRLRAGDLQKLRAANKELGKEITEHGKAVETLQKSEGRFRFLIEHAGEGIFVVDKNKRFLKVNRTACETLGYSREELLSLSVPDIGFPIDSAVYRNSMDKVYAGVTATLEGMHIRKNGTIFPVEIRVRLIQWEGSQAMLALVRDITDRKRAEDRIKTALREKEILLQEIHHRTKNNLQVIASLLRLQARYSRDETHSEMFRESFHRIKSMALVHETILQAPNLEKIDAGEYFAALANGLFRAYGFDRERIGLMINTQGILLNVDTGIPCGLIVNELVSNSLKHAFPGQAPGHVEITLRAINENRLELVVKDDGVGMRENLNYRNMPSLGLQLVTALVEEQLRGDIKMPSHRGTEFRMVFDWRRKGDAET